VPEKGIEPSRPCGHRILTAKKAKAQAMTVAGMGPSCRSRFRSHNPQNGPVIAFSEKQACDKAFLEEFVNFVRREDPKVLPLIEALPATGTLGDAVDWLGITESEFGRMRGRLGQLAKCFLSRKPLPRQRKPYKKRIAKTNQFSGASQFDSAVK